MIGSAIALGVGKSEKPSSTSIIITEVGLLPVMLGLVGVTHEWAETCTVCKTKRKQHLAQIALLVYHIAAATAIAIYAVGASKLFKQPPEAGSKELAEAGIVLLVLLWLAQYAAFGLLTYKIGLHTLYTLFLCRAITLALLGIRVIYQAADAFGSKTCFDRVNGNVVFRVALQFIPTALIILTMVTPGVATIEAEIARFDPAGQHFPLHSHDLGNASSRGGGQ